MASYSSISFSNFLFKRKKNGTPKPAIKTLLGYKPKNHAIYSMALCHRSMREGANENNERLEFLGDAILSMVVGDFLFKKYPYKDEGFLTEMRSKMVNRQKLNDIALRMGLQKLTQFNKADGSLKKSQIFGNTLEALIGAIYLDMGYKFTSSWILKKMIIPFLDTDVLELVEINIKNKILGWAAKTGAKVEFITNDISTSTHKNNVRFNVSILLDDVLIAEGFAPNKKDAGKKAAALAAEKLGLA